jgi:hypothetical protein
MAAACYPAIMYGTVNFAIADTIDSSDLRVRGAHDRAHHHPFADWRHRLGHLASPGRAEKMAAVDDAWQTVLSDPNYERRRQQEEHKLNQARSRR